LTASHLLSLLQQVSTALLLLLLHKQGTFMARHAALLY
jgi:hypothetical protein